MTRQVKDSFDVLKKEITPASLFENASFEKIFEVSKNMSTTFFRTVLYRFKMGVRGHPRV